MLDHRDPVQRRIIAKQLASTPPDERDPQAQHMTGRRASVRLQVPVRSISETRRMLRAIIAELTEIAAALDRARESDQTLLFGAQTRIHRLNKKINCYRSGGRDRQ